MAQEKEQKNALTVKTDRAGGYTIYCLLYTSDAADE